MYMLRYIRASAGASKTTVKPASVCIAALVLFRVWLALLPFFHYPFFLFPLSTFLRSKNFERGLW
jgi:hypothetical protein